MASSPKITSTCSQLGRCERSPEASCNSAAADSSLSPSDDHRSTMLPRLAWSPATKYNRLHECGTLLLHMPCDVMPQPRAPGQMQKLSVLPTHLASQITMASCKRRRHHPHNNSHNVTPKGYTTSPARLSERLVDARQPASFRIPINGQDPIQNDCGNQHPVELPPLLVQDSALSSTSAAVQASGSRQAARGSSKSYGGLFFPCRCPNWAEIMQGSGFLR